MTEQQFKADDQLRIRLRELLNDPVMLAAFDILRGTFEGKDVLDADAPEVVSVRTLSVRAGFESYPIKLRRLTEAPITATQPLKEDWGTNQNE
jgi:hypothetical protein